MTDPKEQTRNQKLPGPLHLLDTVYFRFRQRCKTIGELLDEKQTFQWTQEVEIAFQTLRGAFCTASILARPQPRERFVVDTDARIVGIGGVLSQVQEGQE
jgi:hypothetical protein